MAREIVKQVMVRLTEEDFGALHVVALPGEPASQTFLRALHQCADERDTVLSYRKPPLFPEWVRRGPMSAVHAEQRGQHMIKNGFDVELQSVEPIGAVPLHPDDLVEEEEDPHEHTTDGFEEPDDDEE